MFSLRFGAGQPNFRPNRSSDVRVRSSGPSTPAPAPAAAGPFSQVPFWCIPVLAGAVAMPFYSRYQTNEMIRVGREKAAIRVAADKEGSKKKKEEKKVVEEKKEEPKPVEVKKEEPKPAPAPAPAKKSEEKKKRKWVVPTVTASSVAVGAAAVATYVVLDKKKAKK